MLVTNEVALGRVAGAILHGRYVNARVMTIGELIACAS